MNETPLNVHFLGVQAYEEMWHKMQEFTNARTAETVDECWLLEHESVFTLGQAGKESHLLSVKDIPVIRTDRGGQVTYHGPGQLMMYWMVDLKRKGLGVRDFVTVMEDAIIELLANDEIHAEIKQGAPGVYVNGDKIASLGLRVRKGCTYHGLALNINADLEPFHQINPCGYPGLEMVNMQHFCRRPLGVQEVARELLAIFKRRLHYSNQ